MKQIALFARPLTCCFGEPWPDGPHPLCDAEADRLSAQFEAMVQAGIFNARGYTPSEWRRRKAHHVGTDVRA